MSAQRNPQFQRLLRATAAAIANGGQQPGREQLRALARTTPMWNMGLQVELLRVLGREGLGRFAVECGIADPEALVSMAEAIDANL